MIFKKFLIHYKHSFQLRVFLAMALIVFIFLPGTGYIGFLQASKVVENQLQQYTSGTAVQISKRIRSFLAQHTYNVRLIKSFLENQLIDASNREELLRYFLLFQKDHPEFVNIYYGDANGEFIMAPPQVPEVHKIFDPRVRPWYQGASNSQELHWTNVYLFASTQKPGITVSIPIYDKEGTLLGVCGIDIDLSAFSRFLEGIDIGRQGVAYIFENKVGHVIAHPGLVQLPWNEGQIELLRACLANLKKDNKSFGMTTFQNEEFFTAYTDYPGKDWTVAVTLSTTEHVQNIQLIKNTTFTLVIFAILLASLLSYLLTRTIIRPLHSLQQGIERIASGDLKHKVGIQDPDIASDLAKSFNTMAFSLQKSQEELKATYAELAENEKLAAVGKMTAGIAHEIKNPLGIILGSAQVVLNREKPWEMREKAARFIVDEVARLDTTLKSFLAFARPAPPDLRKTDIIELLEDTLSATEERYREDGFFIKRNFAENVPSFEADSNQMRQVIWNICLNSINAMPDGGSITIRVGVEEDPEILTGEDISVSLTNLYAPSRTWIQISIGDSGCGITKEHLENIMDPFVSYQDDGIGLGLSIVGQIVKQHHGHIKIESKVSEGTTFHLFFPAVSKEYHHVD